MEKKIIRRWGYHPTEPARIFEISEGDDLPEGWADRPFPTVASEEVDAADDAVTTSDDQRVAAAELRAKELEQENASLKEEVSSLQEQLAQVASADVIEIPDDWREGHHSPRIKLAKLLNPEFAEAIIKDADAIEVIEAELKSRDQDS